MAASVTTTTSVVLARSSSNGTGVGNPGALGDKYWREARHRTAQVLEPLDIGVTEGRVVETFFEKEVQQAGCKSRVLARADLHEIISELGGFALSRIDHDQRHAARLGVLDLLQRVRRRIADAEPSGDQRVGAHEHPKIRRLERLAARVPGAQSLDGDELGRLVDREG